MSTSDHNPNPRAGATAATHGDADPLVPTGITPTTHESTSVAEGTLVPDIEPKLRNRHVFGIAIGLVAAVITYLIFPNEVPQGVVDALAERDLETSPHILKSTAAVAVLMGAWWMTEAIPLAATALVPLVAFPALGVTTINAAAAPYASPTIFLFMGGFVLALAMQRWNLHRRIALVTVLLVGVRPKRLVLGFMVATGFLSMWVSNTATAVMMLPIGLSVLALVGQLNNPDGKRSRFGTGLMLGIAYSASIASLSTLIGTPPNALLRGYLADNHDITIGFGQWMLMGFPVAWLLLFIAWWLLTNVLYKPEIDELPGGKSVIKAELDKMGPMSTQEKLVGLVFIAAALSWVFVPVFFPDSPVSDEVIAMAVALSLFLIPARPKGGIGLMDWKAAQDIPWDVLLLFGGGLSLSSAFGSSGLSQWIGEQASGLAGLPSIVIVVACVALVIFLTEMTSNTATAAAFLPIMGGVAIGMGMDVMLLTVPVAMAATCAFMLPVATPPNAIAFGSGYLRIKDMVRAGIWLNLISVVLLTATVFTLGRIFLGIEI